jgi:uncharacterized delta-60 repeat protein
MCTRRSLFLGVLLSLILTVLVLPGMVHAVSAFDGFDPNADGPVNSIALQPDGKILVGGDFSTIGGTERIGIARLNTDGTLDTTFNPDAYDSVSSIAVQADGKILVGGNFTTLYGAPRDNLARLNTDGTLDITFNSNTNGSVWYIALQPDGKILVGVLSPAVSPGSTRTAGWI